MSSAARLAAVLAISACLLAPTVLAQGNHPPAFTSSPPLTAVVGQLYLYDANASDPENDPLTYYLTFSIDDMSVNPTTGALTWTPTKAGSQPITIYVTDGITAQVAQSFTVNVSRRENSAPVFTSQPVRSASVGKPYAYDADAVDPDGERVYYSLDRQSPRLMTIDEATGVVSWTPGDEYLNQSVFVAIIARDINALSGIQQYSIFVKATPVDKNTPPGVNGTPVISVFLGDTYYYKINGTDVDGDTLTYSLVAGNPGNMEINSSTGVITWVPTAGQLGTAQITVNISDGKDNTTYRFSISVRERPDTIHFFTDPARPSTSPDLLCLFLPVMALILQLALLVKGERRRQALARKRPAPQRPSP